MYLYVYISRSHTFPHSSACDVSINSAPFFARFILLLNFLFIFLFFYRVQRERGTGIFRERNDGEKNEQKCTHTHIISDFMLINLLWKVGIQSSVYCIEYVCMYPFLCMCIFFSFPFILFFTFFCFNLVAFLLLFHGEHVAFNGINSREFCVLL